MHAKENNCRLFQMEQTSEVFPTSSATNTSTSTTALVGETLAAPKSTAISKVPKPIKGNVDMSFLLSVLCNYYLLCCLELVVTM